MAGELDDIVVVVGGDISPLETALSGIPEAMAGVSSATADAFAGLDASIQKTASTSTQAATSIGSMAQQTQTASSAAITTAQSMSALSAQVAQANQNLNSATTGWNALTPAITASGNAAQQASASFSTFVHLFTSGLGIGSGVEAIHTLLDGLKELAESVVGTFSQIERSTLALTALTGSVEVANDQIDRLKSLAVSEALSFPELVSANQRMIAMGFSTTATNAALRAAADAAAATGVNLVMVTNSLERMSEAGTLAGRQLATLGLSMQDIAKAMGTTTENAKAMFQAMDPAQRLDVLIAALQKYQGTAQALVASLSGQFKQLSNEIIFALEPVGETIGSVLKSIMADVQESALPAIVSLSNAFKDLATAVSPLVSGALKEAITAIGDIGTSAGGTISMLSKLASGFEELIGKIPGVKTLSEWIGKIPLGPFEQINALLHAASTEFNLMSASADLASDALRRHNQIQHDVIQSIKDLIDNAKYESVNLQNIRDAFNDEKAAAQEALIVLNNTITAYKEGFATLGQVQRAQEDYNRALYAMDPAAKTAADAAKRLADSIDSIVGKSALLLQQVPSNLTEVQTAFNQTGETVKKWESQVEGDLQALKTKMVEMGGATEDMLKAWGHLQQARDQLKLLAAEQAWTHIKDQISALSDKMNQATGATREQLNELAKLQGKLQDAADAVAKLGGTVTQLAKDSAGNWHEITGPIQQADEAIQVINGNMGTTAQQAAFAAKGIQFLTTSTNDNTSATKSASAAQTELGTVFQTTGEKAKTAADAAAGMAKAMENVAAAAKDAADSMEAALQASDALAHSFAVTGFGGGPGGSASPGGQIGTKPGDVITQRGEAGQIISQITVPGGDKVSSYLVNGQRMNLTDQQRQSLEDAGNVVEQIKKLNAAGQAYTDSINKAASAVNSLGAAASQSASSLVSAATSIAGSLTSGTTALSVATDQLNKATDAYDAIAAAYQAGTASADQMIAAQDALNAAYREFVGAGGAITTLSASMTDATGATASLANAAADTASQLVVASQTITDAATAAVNGINALVLPAVQAVAAATEKVLGVNSTTLLPPVGSLPNVNAPAGPGPINSNTLVGRGGLVGPGTPGISIPINVYGGDAEQVAQRVVGILNSMGVKNQ